ncbi:MAG: protein translocase subunit SecD [Chromatiales bacterium]|nr:protein translocase subunit SecD [Chromatiales bacterium]
MRNEYPLWKYVLLVAVILLGLVYAAPNLVSQDPSMLISANRRGEVNEATLDRVRALLAEAGVQAKSLELQNAPSQLLVRFEDPETQLKARDLVEAALGDENTVALTLSANVPGWLRGLGAEPMYLGLDLRGGVHILIDVDMEAATEQAFERFVSDLRQSLRENKLRYRTVSVADGVINIEFNDAEQRTSALGKLEEEFRQLTLEAPDDNPEKVLARVNASELERLREFALEQNITTLRNRVNALGVAEPVIQRQGERHIVVQLPGAQDPARIKDVLGATATLEYRLEDTENSVQSALDGRVPPTSKLYRTREGRPVLLSKRIIVTGDQVVDASSGFDGQNGSPAVFVRLDSLGAQRMRRVTSENVGKPMAVVFIENRTETKLVDGVAQKTTRKHEEVISIANILEPFGARFQTTGLDSSEEARDLALLLRAGALAAPINIVEERTIGPSLGQDNIDQGLRSVVVGFVVVLIFMVVYYKVFGLIADVALGLNLVLIVAVLSMLQATLTLPGIAGIVLTVGMAVDANVLIFERIREELRSGNSPQASIYAGYEKAFSTIVDANVTTLIAAVVLFSFGTGPVKGFAVTLFIGILSSMFTAIVGTRAAINLIYGRRQRVRDLRLAI